MKEAGDRIVRDSLKISVSRLKRDAALVENYIDSIPTLIKELEQSMDQLAQCWDGQAWLEYQNNVALYIEILTEIYRYMGDFTKDLNQAAKMYQRTEQDVCSVIDRVIVL